MHYDVVTRHYRCCIFQKSLCSFRRLYSLNDEICLCTDFSMATAQALMNRFEQAIQGVVAGLSVRSYLSITKGSLHFDKGGASISYGDFVGLVVVVTVGDETGRGGVVGRDETSRHRRRRCVAVAYNVRFMRQRFIQTVCVEK
jgi:hypothetical protein